MEFVHTLGLAVTFRLGHNKLMSLRLHSYSVKLTQRLKKVEYVLPYQLQTLLTTRGQNDTTSLQKAKITEKEKGD